MTRYSIHSGIVYPLLSATNTKAPRKKDRSGTFVLLVIAQAFKSLEAVHYRLRDLQTPASRSIPKSLLDSKASTCYTHLRFGTPIHPIASAPKKHPPAALAEAENVSSKNLEHAYSSPITDPARFSPSFFAYDLLLFGRLRDAEIEIEMMKWEWPNERAAERISFRSSPASNAQSIPDDESRRPGRVCVLGGSRSLPRVPRVMDHESLIDSDLDNREREWGEEDEYGRLRMGSLAKLMGLMAEAICYVVCMHEAMKG
ncbi:hypothetical protein SISNIDRAFT_496496 [Sistotremastrum niveocremeum HHB9708]|uniref:Uncharacterized protein n=1 Tax=Sistotremastrum niveocremeum HHB9708 TaxID=1314777 RepID=A0A164SNT5_9AGAM|nr:hypothetical protein SISNIDRAFT_496496 [Sistotremastrum niveocremeum HHB9708]